MTVLVLSPMMIPLLHSLRLGYLADISSLTACIVASHLDKLILCGVLFCPAWVAFPERTVMLHCTRLRQVTVVGVDACGRDTVGTFFRALSSLNKYPTALNITLTNPTDLVRFLLRHKTVPVSPLKRIDLTEMQFSAAYERPGHTVDLGGCSGSKLQGWDAHFTYLESAYLRFAL
ncbi:hypothetical protein B0H11DRAFT_2290342 [Mycena galericulata]|nr:hypothetical protein B0H11DRAFT_2290342 [Mycena galericulata]